MIFPFPTEWKNNIHVPNHQPVTCLITCYNMCLELNEPSIVNICHYDPQKKKRNRSSSCFNSSSNASKSSSSTASAWMEMMNSWEHWWSMWACQPTSDQPRKTVGISTILAWPIYTDLLYKSIIHWLLPLAGVCRAPTSKDMNHSCLAPPKSTAQPSYDTTLTE